jgi:hypothetical protein
MKKDKLNPKKLYQTHSKVAQEWGKSWHTIRNSIHEAINKNMDRKYNTIRQRLKKLEHTQISTPKHIKTFYPRVVNNTNMKFTADELNLLNKGLKYNLSFKNKNWIKTLTLEAETAVAQLPTQEQDYVRVQVAHNLKQLYRQYNTNKQYNSNQAKYKNRILNQIKEKLTSNNNMALKADKGNSIVIMYVDDYHNKVQNFIASNNFTCCSLPTHITKHRARKYQNRRLW